MEEMTFEKYFLGEAIKHRLYEERVHPETRKSYCQTREKLLRTASKIKENSQGEVLVGIRSGNFFPNDVVSLNIDIRIKSHLHVGDYYYFCFCVSIAGPFCIFMRQYLNIIADSSRSDRYPVSVHFYWFEILAPTS